MRRVAALFTLALAGCGDNAGPTVFDEAPKPDQTLTIVVNEPDRMFIEHPPFIVAGGNEAFVYRDEITFLVQGRRIREVFTFHGVDKGDEVEMDTNIFLDGVPVLLRSDHGLDEDNDAWGPPKDVDRRGQRVTISILCRVTGVNPLLNRLAARPHWGVWLTFDERQTR